MSRSLSAAVVLAGLGLVACGGGTGRDAVTLPAADPRAVQEFNAGNRLLGRGRSARARARFERALEIDPNLWEAHYNLGVVERRAGRIARATAQFESALRIQPNATEPTLALAEVRYVAGDRGQAVDLLRRVVGDHPNDLAARVALATVLREEGSFNEALSEAREVLIRDAENVPALLEVGRCYRARQEPDVAELVFRKALDKLGENAEAHAVAEVHNELGLLALSRGDTQAAFVAFREAIQRDPSFTPAHMNQGSVLLDSGDYQSAAEAYRAVLSVDNDDLSARCALGVALRGAGDIPGARRAYRAVLDEDANYAPALFNMGVLLAEFANQRGPALAYFRRFLAAVEGDHPKRAAAEEYVRNLQESGS